MERCFFEMGMDSLFLTQIALKLKNELKVEISFRQLTEEFADLQCLCEFYKDKVDLGEDVEVQATPVSEAPAMQPTQTSAADQPAQVAPQQVIMQQAAQPIQMVQQQAPVNTNGLEGLMAQQITLMQNQIALLSQGNIQVAQPVTTTVTASPSSR